MIVSENFASPDARRMLTTDFCNRYTSADKFYRGSRFTDEVQALAEEVARKVFNARFADVRPLSGHIADMAVLYGLTKRGDKVLSVSLEDGGYQGITPDGPREDLRAEEHLLPVRQGGGQHRRQGDQEAHRGREART